ncbi:MAG: NAD(P)/FAD-dependent oxidoreductase [Acidimicrobiales bacterium]|nr:NAD(P)/FAD-dependent oxidoreductase [Acidimicrobiales bacterium]
MTERTITQFAIIGAGAGGMCAGIRLAETGRDDFLIFDKAPSVGGTWFRNAYPGACCDIPSHVYSYSFAPSAEWSKPYGTQPEILEYLEKIADDYGLRPHLRLSTGVASAAWDESRARWVLVLDSGEEVEAQYVIGAVGMFGKLNYPEIDGLGDFSGVMFHSAKWNHDHDLSGKRVAVLGSAASAVQLIPELAKVAGQLHVFQRTPNWILPKADTLYTEEQKQTYRDNPEQMAHERQQLFEAIEVGLDYTKRTTIEAVQSVAESALDVIEDPELRRKLTPDHPWGCKRPLLSNNYLPTFNQDNVELVTEPIDRLSESGVVTADGTEREVDVIVLATGFETTRYVSAIDIRGRDGNDLDDVWGGDPVAYLGVTTAGFPNLFMLYGPNTNGGNSIILMLEHQVEYFLRLLDDIERTGFDWLDVRQDVMDEFNDALQDDINGVDVWQASCNGYYRSASGRIVTQWPFNFTEYCRRTEGDDISSFYTGHATSRNPGNYAVSGVSRF